VNEATAGPGVVQLWSVPETDTCAYGHGGLPACELLLHHGGRVVWDMAWCPDASAFGLDLAPDGPGQLPVLGLLALVLGDGSVQLVAVPDPLALRARAASADRPSQQQPHSTNDAAGAAPAPLEARVKPLVTLRGAAAGISGLPSCCAWDPSAPHERLIVGSWDGTCSLWTLPRAAAGQPALALHFRVDGMPTRRVQFFPPDALASSTGAHRHIVMTAGDSGVLRLWDLSTGQPWPLLSRNLGRNAIFDATVAAPPGLVSVLAAMEDGSLRHLHLDAIGLSFARDTAFEVLKGPGGGTACLWAIDCCRGAPLAGYCGEEGIVGLMAVQHELDARRRMPHAAIGALRCVPGGGLRVYTADEVPTPSGLYGGGGAYRKPAVRSVWACSALKWRRLQLRPRPTRHPTSAHPSPASPLTAVARRLSPDRWIFKTRCRRCTRCASAPTAAQPRGLRAAAPPACCASSACRARRGRIRVCL
jgi:hypothetical protein